MIELLLPCGFDTLEYSWVKATIDICTLADYSVAKKHQQPPNSSTSLTECSLTRRSRAKGATMLHASFNQGEGGRIAV
jgi:hypothetical protein